MRNVFGAAVALTMALIGSIPSVATAQDTTQDSTALDDVIVLARSSGAPMWTVTRGDSTLILVGAIRVPEETRWRPDALEAAVARSRLVLLPQNNRASPADFFRVIWRARTITRLPDGQTTADYLSPEWQSRLEAVMRGGRDADWRSDSFLILSSKLMRDEAGYDDRGGVNAVDVARRAGRATRVPVRDVGFVRGDDMIENLLATPPAALVPCMEAAIAAAEAGPDNNRLRAEAWRKLRVAEVVANPLDVALGSCWPWADPEIAPIARRQWAEAIDAALTTPGVTMAVVQLRLLAESGGVLDGMEARGLEPEGPDWKRE